MGLLIIEECSCKNIYSNLIFCSFADYDFETPKPPTVKKSMYI